MNIIEVIVELNQMVADGVVDRYAIGGAVGATFYLEPVATMDIDVFLSFRQSAGSLIVSPKLIYDHLKARGHAIEGEYVIIGGWPVQFLPPASPLVEEALVQAIEVDLDGMSVRVFTAEHLAAIALQTGRAKDKARLLQFVEEIAFDTITFESMLKRHELLDRWFRFQQQFLNDTPR